MVCCRLNACIILEFGDWNLISNEMVFGDGAFERWLGHVTGAFMNGIHAPGKEAFRVLFPSAMWGHWERKAATSETESGPSQQWNPPLSGFPSYLNGEQSISLFLKPLSPWHSLSAAHKGYDMSVAAFVKIAEWSNCYRDSTAHKAWNTYGLAF